MRIMNTKQLWNSLCLNPITNKYFDGVYSSDTLTNIKQKPELIICNTDPSNKPGKHWVLFFFDENSVDFYDSLGRDLGYYGNVFSDFINKFVTNFTQCKIRTQPVKSDLCGQYCLYYAFAKCIGLSMDDIIINMPDFENVVDFVNRTYYICPLRNSSFLQKCSRC